VYVCASAGNAYATLHELVAAQTRAGVLTRAYAATYYREPWFQVHVRMCVACVGDVGQFCRAICQS
jgi:hypothetical protein